MVNTIYLSDYGHSVLLLTENSTEGVMTRGASRAVVDSEEEVVLDSAVCKHTLRKLPPKGEDS